jgi:hypothetical protein
MASHRDAPDPTADSIASTPDQTADATTNNHLPAKQA